MTQSTPVKRKFNLLLLPLLLCVILALSYFSKAHANNNSTLSQPNMPANALLVLANEAAVAVYDYNFANYRKALQMASEYFTPQAWQNYQDALTKSHNLDTVIHKKLVVTGVATGAPIILQQGVVNNKYSWTVEIPMLITYQNATTVIKQHMIITLQMVRTPENMGIRGVGIDQFTAMPADKTAK